jgi:hypothetical protein
MIGSVSGRFEMGGRNRLLSSVAALVLLASSLTAAQASSLTGNEKPPLTAGAAGTEINPNLAPEAALATLETKLSAQGALGFYTDAATQTLVVVVPPSVRDAFLLPNTDVGIPLRLESAKVEPSDITAVYARLDALREELAALGATYAYGFEPGRGRVEIDGTIPAAAMASLLGQLASDVEYHQVSGGGRLSRQNDSAPFWGGAAVTDFASPTTHTCTTGFTVKNAAGTRFLTTAGHCFGLSVNVFSPYLANQTGKITNKAPFPNRDMELIGTKTYGPVIYTGDAVGVASTVKGASDPVEGRNIYCYSGEKTADNCGYTVTDSSFNYCDADGCTPDSLQFTYAGCQAQSGDSGAPFYLDFAYGGYPYIRGMVYANLNGYCYGHKWSSISSYFGVSIVTG